MFVLSALASLDAGVMAAWIRPDSDVTVLSPRPHSLQLVAMVQVIRDLANAFVPSGKLIDIVDKDLVSIIVNGAISHSGV